MISLSSIDMLEVRAELKAEDCSSDLQRLATALLPTEPWKEMALCFPPSPPERTFLGTLL